MANYGIVKDNLIVNTVVWDGEGDIFADYITFEIKDDAPAQIGDVYLSDILYPKPRDGYDYDFNSENLKWLITADSANQQAADKAQENLVIAQDEYNRASTKIGNIQDQIDDEDYSATETEESLKATKTTWTNYRKSLRAYISTADGTIALPTAPDA